MGLVLLPIQSPITQPTGRCLLCLPLDITTPLFANTGKFRSMTSPSNYYFTIINSDGSECPLPGHLPQKHTHHNPSWLCNASGRLYPQQQSCLLESGCGRPFVFLRLEIQLKHRSFDGGGTSISSSIRDGSACFWLQRRSLWHKAKPIKIYEN